MTATAIQPPLPRLAAVARLHQSNWLLLVVLPLAVPAVTFAINAIILAFVTETGENDVTGGIAALYGFALVFYIQAMDRTMALAVALGVTRREFLSATGLLALAQALAFGTLLFVLELVERATHGWGMKLRMFDIPGYYTHSLLLQWLSFVLLQLVMASIGLLLGALYQRWQRGGIFLLTVGVVVVFATAGFLVTLNDAWPSVGHWFADLPRAVPVVVFPLAIVAVVAGAAWATVRRSPIR